MLDLLKTTLSSFCSPVEAISRAMEGVQAACAWRGVNVGAAGEQRAPCLWGRGQSRLDGSRKDSLLAWVVDSRTGTHLMLGCSWAIPLSLGPWGPAAGPLLQEALQPPKPHPAPSLASLKAGAFRNQAARGLEGVYCQSAWEPTSLGFVHLPGHRLPPEDQEDG